MIAVDTNILVYAHRVDSSFHAAASAAVAYLAEGPELWAIPWPCLHEFLAIVTHPRIYKPSTPSDRALLQVEAWLESPTLRLLAEREAYWPVLEEMMARGKIMGPQVHDARIAALCRAHGVSTLWSADRDFSRFDEVRVVNPVMGGEG